MGMPRCASGNAGRSEPKGPANDTRLGPARLLGGFGGGTRSVRAGRWRGLAPLVCSNGASTRGHGQCRYESYGGGSPVEAYAAIWDAGPSSSFIQARRPEELMPPRIRKEASLFSVLRREEGQGLAEYALILALICLAVVAGVMAFGTTVQSMMSNIATTFGTL